MLASRDTRASAQRAMVRRWATEYCEHVHSLSAIEWQRNAVQLVKQAEYIQVRESDTVQD